MKKIRLFEQLKTFDSKEIKHLEKYLNSPFFNSNENINNLFTYIKDAHPDDFYKLDKQEMLHAAFPDEEEVASKKLNNLMWHFCQIIEDFFIQSELKDKPEKRAMLLKDSYFNRQLASDYKTELNKLVEFFVSSDKLSFNHNIRKIQILQEQLFEFPKDFFDNLREYKYPFEDFENALDFLVVHSQLNIAQATPFLDSLNLPYTLKGNYNELSSKEKQRRLLVSASNPLIALLAYIHDLNTVEYESKKFLLYFSKAVNLYLKHYKRFSLNEQRKLVTVFINTSHKSQPNLERLCSYLYPIIKLVIEENIITEKNQLTLTMYSNIVTIGCTAGYFESTRNWIDELSLFLPEEIRENEKKIAIANFMFRKGNYEEVSFYLDQTVISNPSRKIFLKALTLRSSYELIQKDNSWYFFMKSNLRSYDRFIQRSGKIEERYKLPHKNFLMVFKKLVNRKMNINRNEKHQKELELLLAETPVIAYSSWLRKKIKTLLN